MISVKAFHITVLILLISACGSKNSSENNERLDFSELTYTGLETPAPGSKKNLLLASKQLIDALGLTEHILETFTHSRSTSPEIDVSRNDTDSTTTIQFNDYADSHNALIKGQVIRKITETTTNGKIWQIEGLSVTSKNKKYLIRGSIEENGYKDPDYEYTQVINLIIEDKTGRKTQISDLKVTLNSDKKASPASLYRGHDYWIADYSGELKIDSIGTTLFHTNGLLPPPSLNKNQGYWHLGGYTAGRIDFEFNGDTLSLACFGGEHIALILPSERGPSSIHTTWKSVHEQVILPQLVEPPFTYANPGNEFNSFVGAEIKPHGLFSRAPDNAPVSFHWSFDSVPLNSKVKIVNENTPYPTFTPDVPGQYYLSLTATDGNTLSIGTTLIYVSDSSLRSDDVFTRKGQLEVYLPEEAGGHITLNAFSVTRNPTNTSISHEWNVFQNGDVYNSIDSLTFSFTPEDSGLISASYTDDQFMPTFSGVKISTNNQPLPHVATINVTDIEKALTFHQTTLGSDKRPILLTVADNYSSDKPTKIQALSLESDNFFKLVFELEANYSVKAIQTGDLNNDGLTDIVIAAKDWPIPQYGGLGVFLASEDGFLPATYSSFDHRYKMDQNSDIVIGNMDGIEGNEIILQPSDSNGLSYWKVTGSGIEYAPTSIIANEAGYIRSIADFNNDGTLDLLAKPNEPTSKIRFYFNAGNSEFTEGDIFNVDEYAQIYSGDFNGNNRLDLLVVGSRSVRFYLQENAGEFSLFSDYPSDLMQGIDNGFIADIDDDGDMDIVIKYSRALTLGTNSGDNIRWTTIELNTNDISYNPEIVILDVNFNASSDLVMGGSRSLGHALLGGIQLYAKQIKL